MPLKRIVTKLDPETRLTMLWALEPPVLGAALRSCEPSLAAAVAEVTADPWALRRYDVNAAVQIALTMWDPSAVLTAELIEKRTAVLEALMENRFYPRAGVPVGSGAVRTFDEAAAAPDPLASVLAFLDDNGHITGEHVCNWLASLPAPPPFAAALLHDVLTSTDDLGVATAVVRLAFTETVPALAVDELLDANPESVPAACFAALEATSRMSAAVLRMAELDEEFAASLWEAVTFGELIRAGTDPLTASGRAYLRTSPERCLDPARLAAGMLDEAAVTELVTTSEVPVWVLLALCRREEDIKAVTAALCEVGSLLDRWRHGPDSFDVIEGLPSLSDEARVTLLAHSQSRTVTRWFDATGPAAPRPGEVAALVERMGQAPLDHRPVWAVLRRMDTLYPGSVDFDGSPAVEFVLAALERTPGVVADLLTVHLDEQAALLVYRLLAAECGTDEEMWATVLGLAYTWEGTLPELVAAARKL